MNIQWYKIATQTGVIKEALRTLKGYDRETEDREIRSLVDFEFSKYDEVVYVHPELEIMLKKNDEGKKLSKRKKNSKEVDNRNIEEIDNPVINIYKKQFGKKPRKDGVFGSCVISLLRTIGRTEEDFPDIALMSVNEAKKAMGQFYATYEYGKVWLKKAVECFIELLGIRDKDVLYIVLHVDESTVHIHCGFFPAYIIKDKNKNVRKDLYGKEIYGCDRSIVSRGFLQSLHTKRVEKMKKEKNMEYAECLLTGEGYYFDPQKMTRAQKEAAERALIEDEILQAKIDKGLITEIEAEGQFHYKDFKLKNKKRLIKEKEELTI